MRVCRCPECGASLQIRDTNREFAFCEYCGSKIMLDDYRSTQRIIDEARIKQAETDRIVRLRSLELDGEKHTFRTILTIIWVILSIIILAICIINVTFGKDRFVSEFFLIFYIGGPIIGGGAYLLFKFLPDQEYKKTVVRNGGIIFPESVFPLSDQHYETMETTLRNLGFRNITCVNKHDITLGLLQKPGKVDSVSVGGESLQSAGSAYMPDTPIVITYHGR